jgi:agmatine deiminase
MIGAGARDGTPSAAGFAMPAEWSRHARSWMAWPCRESVWQRSIEPARAAYAAVARAIAAFEPVTMVVRPDQAAAARAALGPAIDIMPLPLDDSWTRDIGPTFVVDRQGGVAGIDWRFNGWGGKYPDHGNDDALASAILEQLGMPRFSAPFVLEGGAIHVDGDGTLLTTEQCLLNPNRNPLLDRPAMEAALSAWLGVEKIIWLGHGLVEDETDGHVDNLACFARPGLVAALVEDDPADANHAPLAENLARLRAARDAAGRVLEIVPIQEPAARHRNGARLPLSYLNFYLVNGAVIAPIFDDPADDPALAKLAQLFPERKIVAVPAIDIVAGGGGIHCITQQQPAGRAAP